jgi:hypothetical protein
VWSEDEIWGLDRTREDDAAAFVDHLDDDQERYGVTAEEPAAAYGSALDVRRSQPFHSCGTSMR